MKKRLIALVALVATLVTGVMVGTAYAATTTPLGSTGITVTRAQQDYTSPAWGEMSYFVECPTGTKVLGGGGWARINGTAFWPLKGSWPDDSNGRWYTVFDLPQSFSTAEVHVFATCASLN